MYSWNTISLTPPYNTTYYKLWPDRIKCPRDESDPPLDIDTSTKPTLALYIDMRIEAPSDIFHLACIVTPVLRPKRMRRSPTPDPESYYKRARTVLAAPSQSSTHVTAHQEDPQERIWTDRPEREDDIAPIALLYAGFGRFLDVFEGREQGWGRLSRSELEKRVDAFSAAMRSYYTDETPRGEKVLPLLESIFRLGVPSCSFTAASIDRVSSDGHCMGPLGLPTVVVEFKNETNSGRINIPDEQALASLLHSYHHAQSTNTRKTRHLRTPALGIVVMGPHIAFYAFALLDRPRLVQLTPMLSTAGGWEDLGRASLVTAFRAAVGLFRDIMDDHAAAAAASHTPAKSLSHPYVSSAPAFPTSSNQADIEIEFSIEEPMPRGRHVYLARTAATHQRVVVKFTRTYSTSLHAFCAARSRAPQLLAYGEVPGGWKVVVMEYIDAVSLGVIKSTPGLARRYLETWCKDVWDVVRAFHAEGWVHGDLRFTNILVARAAPERALLIDFDWGGRDGEARFPTTELNPFLKEGRDEDDLVIRKADDERVLAGTFEVLAAECHIQLRQDP
ncbi:hypothetical protein PLICRDRAFT_39469 [Plicaturopsis crispa FD-325 SS-3]|nr:hypothetical protein PLICRDRAFT_39469 [Plicaturopsis crispa FD-325 SS-3]